MVSDELIDARASAWLAARDARVATPGEIAEFNAWLDADIRHRVAYLRLESTWQRADQLRDVRPLDRAADADLLRPPRVSRRPWVMALAAGVVVAMLGGFWAWQQNFSWQRYETPIGGLSHIVLMDGSVIDLNTNSDVRVRLRGDRREVRLMRGEGRFQVAHDKQRPFTVAAADAAVRAVGTAFTVRVRDERVDVLVSEGKVAVAASKSAETPPVSAGEAAVVLADRVSVSTVDPQVLARRLAWTSGSPGIPRRDARRGRRRIQSIQPAPDPAVGRDIGCAARGRQLQRHGSRRFAGALASAFKLRVGLDNVNEIVLIPL